MILNKSIHRNLYIFLFSHLLIWTLVPSLTNTNLPLDTIEALAWGSNLDWGFNKHPPLSAFAVELFYQIFGNQDWAYYLLSQIFVILAFIAIFKLAYDLFGNLNLALISVMLLEGIYFYNYTTPEFNVNVSQLPFWALSALFTWRCIKYDKKIDFVILALFLGLGFLSKYLFIYLIIGIKILFIYLFINKKIKSYNFFIIGPVALIVVSPHLVWLVQNEFISLSYGLQRIGVNDNQLNHLIFPLIFILKQIAILIPLFLMFLFLIKKIKIRKFILDSKMIFLLFTFILPIFLIILTSTIFGVKIRTMWMTPFYLLSGIMLIQIFKSSINIKNLKKFYLIFLLLFFISPATYTIVSLTNDFKRTDYPGKEIARLVQNRWDENYYNEIKLVIGDEWYAGNLSYHLSSRPKWIIELKKSPLDLKIGEGTIYTGNPKILKNICPGVYGTIKPVGYCMIGQR
tara:strand:- start:41 stop:1411 length:1371 start_codon:yes stop_codon:yes gene_type:complete